MVGTYICINILHMHNAYIISETRIVYKYPTLFVDPCSLTIMIRVTLDEIFTLLARIRFEILYTNNYL